jgi:hypothetical protein
MHGLIDQQHGPMDTKTNCTTLVLLDLIYQLDVRHQPARILDQDATLEWGIGLCAHHQRFGWYEDR